jgi:NADH-quinone oxidoreductase subunit L
MAGPTPVSALIHAATMVAAGVFLIVRMWPLFEASPAARLVILVLAVITALGAALAAVAQGDIKKVLAYSTISQLGFMFAALGAGAWGAAMFHLTTHAAFKALLFLGAGSVIHATDTQELSEMGGLARKMPITAATWLIGVGALAGVPPLSGFFSKDEIVHDVLFAQPIAGVLLLVAAFVTALYVSRVTLLAFFGKPRGEAHAHESGLTMAVPLVLLAIPAALAGFAGPAIASLLGEEAAPLSWPVAATSAGVAVTGLVVGWLIWRRGMEAERSVAARIPVIWGTLREAFRVDVIYGAVARGTVSFARSLASAFDQGVIDRTAEGTAVVTRGAGRFLTRLQYGDGQLYAMLVGAGFILMMAVAAWFGGGAR